MANVFQPPPIWALPILVDEKTQKAIFNPVWLRWFLDFVQNVSAAGASSGSVTSVDASVTSILAVSGVPITAAGTISIICNPSDPGNGGFWPDVTSTTQILRVRDKSLFGDANLYTGNKDAPYGTDPISTYVGTWLDKNSQVIVGSTNGRIGFMGWSNLSDSDTSGSSIAIAGVARTKKSGGTSRSFYAEAVRESGTASMFGLEVAGTNRGSDVTGNSYTLSEAGGVYGLHLIMEGSTGYTVGDSDTPVTVGSAPGTAAINIGAGTGGTTNKRWNMGIRFVSNAISGTDGTTGTGQAIQLAKGHEINWMASSTIQGAKIRSDVTASSGFDVSMIFEPAFVAFYGTTGKRTFATQHATNGVNNIKAVNAATGTYPVLFAEGDDATVGIWFCTKGVARYSFYNTDTSHEELRVGGVYTSPVNYFHAYGSSSGSKLAVLETKGSDTDIHAKIIPKGAGRVVIPIGSVPDYADDAAAAATVPVGGIYRNGSVLMIRAA